MYETKQKVLESVLSALVFVVLGAMLLLVFWKGMELEIARRELLEESYRDYNETSCE